MDVEGRIARALLDLRKEPDAMTHPDGMQLHITRQEVGRIVGCSREMAGRVMKEMEDKGLSPHMARRLRCSVRAEVFDWFHFFLACWTVS